MAAKKGSGKAGGRRKAAKVRDLSDRSGRGAKGGAQPTSNSVVGVINDLLDAVKTAGSKS